MIKNAGCSGWWPGGAVVCWWMLGCWRMVWPAVVDGWRLMLQAGGCWPFWGPERQGGRAAAGVMVCRGWPGLRGDGLLWMAGAGNDSAAICGGNSAVFNQPLTTFHVVAMVLGLTVFFLCSYCRFWRRLGRFRFPGAWVVVGGLVVVWDELSTGTIKGGGSGKRVGVFLRWGKIYSPTSSTPLSDLWGSGKQGHPLCKPAAENDQEACHGF